MGVGVASMAIDLVLESLRRVPLFTGLTSEQIAAIGCGARRCAFRPGEVIVEAREPADGAYLLLSGDAVCTTGPDARGQWEPVEAGSLLGEVAMLVEHDYGATVMAQAWVDCLKLERATLQGQMRADPDIARRIADVIRDRLITAAAALQIVDQLLAGPGEQAAEGPIILMPPWPTQGPAAAASLAH
jgi:CRP-like cAMP-binding protein